MFGRTYRLPFKLLGIPLHLDISFLIILPILAWMIAQNIPEYVETFGLDVAPEQLQEGSQELLLGLVAAVGLFASIVIHELGHSVIGRAYGMQITHITLWVLGGMAHFKEISRRPGAEAVMAIAGPVTSFGVAALAWGALFAVPKDMAAARFVLSYLLWMNMVLGVFNLLPALPLDGGRVLRSLLALRMGHGQATQLAAGISRGLAFLLMLFGFVSFNLFLVVVAFFVLMAGAGESQMAAIRSALKGMSVTDVMTAAVKTVPQNLSVRDLLQRMCEDKHLAYPVVDFAGEVVGIVTLRQIQDRGHMMPPAGEEVFVGDVMLRDFGVVSPSDTALKAFERMQQEPTGRLVVLDASRKLSGIVSKTDLVQCVQLRLVERAIGAR